MNLNYKCIKMTSEVIPLMEPYLVIESFKREVISKSGPKKSIDS